MYQLGVVEVSIIDFKTINDKVVLVGLRLRDGDWRLVSELCM